MKYLRRYLSLLFALVMSLNLFCVVANAAENKGDLITRVYMYPSHAYQEIPGGEFTSGGTVSQLTYTLNSIPIDYNTIFMYDLEIEADDGGKLALAGKTVKLSMSGMHCSFYIPNYDKWYNWQALDALEIIAVYDDSTYGYFGGEFTYDSGVSTHNIKGEFTAEKDVRKIIIRAQYLPRNRNGIALSSANVTFKYFQASGQAPTIQIDTPTKDQELLGGILNGITDVWKTCEAGFANMVKGITDLPAKIWEFIESGLKSLFVPSEEAMTAYKDKWDQLLSQRLGAVYQVVNILLESWEDIMSADQTDTIEFPSATVSFSGTPFTFGGYTVKIVPDGFSVLVTAIKSITGIVCTIAFINGLRKRYDEIMGVEQ